MTISSSESSTEVVRVGGGFEDEERGREVEVEGVGSTVLLFLRFFFAGASGFGGGLKKPASVPCPVFFPFFSTLSSSSFFAGFFSSSFSFPLPFFDNVPPTRGCDAEKGPPSLRLAAVEAEVEA